MINRPVELFNILCILRPDRFSKFQEFVNRYCDPKQGQWGMTYDGQDNIEELH